VIHDSGHKLRNHGLRNLGLRNLGARNTVGGRSGRRIEAMGRWKDGR
jgi:hypothetical protein